MGSDVHLCDLYGPSKDSALVCCRQKRENHYNNTLQRHCFELRKGFAALARGEVGWK